MEALWNLEDKWKITTQEAFLIFICSALAVIGLCTTAILKKRKEKKNGVPGRQFFEEESGSKDMTATNWSESSLRWVSMKKTLISSVRWSGANKWEDTACRTSRQTNAPPLLLAEGGSVSLEFGCWSHNSDSPVWQRPILMGEKCEFPKFSGLILYDEQGRSLHGSELLQQDISAAPVVTTLRDLL
ncbi:hypothetical protein MKW98_018570 [Papaver atlanticum]|uniref:Transmembrane protein n=1 Tax=Papaver atlanticum TaxID=357466 RepID=A0AAD4T4X1_9MAGN|nr:hypothetical protein MKW98_018570 [Papaver atlanticum]